MNDGNGRKNGKPAMPPVVRCAIYTRKSTDEGLEQEFNSLDAQRESAELYIRSQQELGWTCLPDRYDDGGYSGGNMERPALKRLMADIEAGRLDCIVVYKVDRLSRSLMDFARLMETFERKKISFVSVTQQFNTTHSMGRLTLNILLSFAQFEREIIAERTRDKMSAARKKGKWVGGQPMLGYDVDPRGGRLVVNEIEAARVREIFTLYLERQSLLETAKELNERGWTTKRWITKKGRETGGKPFHKANLFTMLTNVVYIGKVHYKGEFYQGEHEATVDADVFRRVQEQLRRNGRNGGSEVRNKYGALLKGLLYCVPCEAAMVHAYTVKNGSKRYRYYVCSKAQKHGWHTCPTKSVPAGEIERFVVERIRLIGKDPEVQAATVEQARAASLERVNRLEQDRRLLERDLRRYADEMRRLAGETPGGWNDGMSVAGRLAELQDRIREVEQRATEVQNQITEANREQVDEREVAAALEAFDPVWDTLSSKEQARVLRLLIERVAYDGEKGTLAVTFRNAGIKTLAKEMGHGGREGMR